ncbi:MAG: putative polysaccharide biosynthesis protein [Eubacterium sp.]|jgi:stage V sporulation protein B
MGNNVNENKINDNNVNNNNVNTSKNDSSRKVLKGAAIIGVSGVIVKILGACFRIPLTNWIGADGMSYYGYAYQIYGTLVILATAGIPVAISRLVAENISRKQYRNAHRVFQTSLIIMTVLGAVLFSICFFFAGPITRTLGNPGAFSAVRAVAPALFFVSVLSTFRGYFQGRQNMNPTAISEIVEQLVRVIVGLSLAYSLLDTSLEKTAAGAAFGATAGSIAALVIIVVIFFMNIKVIRLKISRGLDNVESYGDIAKKIAAISIPIIIGSMIMPIMNLTDTIIVMRRLQSTGFSYEESRHLYGLISGYCSTLIGLPQIFTQAVAISLVPAISSARAVDDADRVRVNTSLGYRLTMIMAFPCALGIFALAKPILLLLYRSRPGEAAEAAPTLMIMAIGVIGLAISQTSTGVLQAIGKQTLPVYHLLFGMVAKVVLTYILVGINSLNIKGAAISTLVAYAISFILNNISVRKYTGIKFDYVKIYAKPGIASVVMCVLVMLAYKLFSGFAGNTVSTLISIFVGIVVYFLMIIILKAVTPEELDSFSIGRKINKIFRRFYRN